jgi:hypothetical protein
MVNEIKLSGQIITDPESQTDDAGSVTSRFMMECEAAARVIRVIAAGPALNQLAQFSKGDSIKCEGRLWWNLDGKMGILATRIFKYTPGVYRRNLETLNHGDGPRVQLRDK